MPPLESPTHTALWRRPSRTIAVRKAGDDGERGSIALYMAILAAGMIAMAGLVIDGGNALATKEKAADVAEQAARAGADALSPESLRNGSPDQLRADPVAARKAANAIMADNGATGTVTFDGNTVTVRATIPKKTAVLSVVHLNDISQTATWSATAIHGTTVAGN